MHEFQQVTSLDPTTTPTSSNLKSNNPYIYSNKTWIKYIHFYLEILKILVIFAHIKISSYEK